jgi:hypothetical protein
MKTKEYKIFTLKSDEITEKFNNSETYKEYKEKFKEVSNLQLMDKKLLKKYNDEKKIYMRELNYVLNTYYNTDMYLAYLHTIEKKQKELVQTKEATDMNRCAFNNYKEDYIVIIKMLLIHLKSDKINSKEYRYLNKLNLKKLTFNQFKNVSLIFNRVTGLIIFNYV